MAATATWLPEDPALPSSPASVARAATPERHLADAIRTLVLDAAESPQAAGAALPLGMAEAATALWTRFRKFDAADPAWPDRDRFVLSAGHGALLLYALLHLTGHDGMDREEIRRNGQLNAMVAAHLELGAHPGIEASTGQLGQGLATAVGMALAERLLAARFGRSLVDHRTWVIASDGDLTQGVTHEAISLAGQLRLQKLSVIWDDNSAANDTAAGEDQLKHFTACGWTVKQVDGDDAAQITAALSMSLRSKKPTLIACRRTLAAVPPRASQDISDAVVHAWHRAGMRGSAARRGWLKRLAHHPLRAEFERVISGKFPDGWYEVLAQLKAELAETRPVLAAATASRRVQDALQAALPELISGCTHISTTDPPIGAVAPGSFNGRHVHYGMREHGMAAAMNGMALHGGVVPCGGIGFAFTDYTRPALQLAAIMRRRVVYLLTNDSTDTSGPTHQPVEHLAGLRAMPNAYVFRPADAIETVECWELALRRADGPSLIALLGQDLPALRADAAENRSARGGYVLAEANGPRHATIVASGSEVHLAVAAREALAVIGIPVAVVSLPCWELFALQDESYRAQVLGAGLRVGVEAASGFGWERWLGGEGVFVGIPGFGAAGYGEDVYRQFGITVAAIADAVRKRLADNTNQERLRGNGH